MKEEKVYIFQGESASFCSAAFSNLENAETWIKKHALTGMLTAYPLNKPVYDWAIENEYFTPNKEHQKSSKFIGGFTSARLEHYHYENGETP